MRQKQTTGEKKRSEEVLMHEGQRSWGELPDALAV
jgi:hypothetical protein